MTYSINEVEKWYYLLPNCYYLTGLLIKDSWTFILVTDKHNKWRSKLIGKSKLIFAIYLFIITMTKVGNATVLSIYLIHNRLILANLFLDMKKSIH